MIKIYFVIIINWVGGLKMKKKIVDLEKRGGYYYY